MLLSSSFFPRRPIAGQPQRVEGVALVASGDQRERHGGDAHPANPARHAPTWTMLAHDTPRSIRWLSDHAQSGVASVGGVRAKGADLQNRRRAIGPRTTTYPTGPAHAMGVRCVAELQLMSQS